MSHLSKSTLATKRHIADTFFELYKEMPIEKITVSMLSKTAHLHRSTFYEYFSDVYAVLDFIEEDTLSSYLAELKSHNLLVSGGFSTERISMMLSIYARYIDRIYYLVNKSPSFKKRLFQTLEPEFLEFTGIDKSIPDYDFLSGFILNTLVYALNFWHENQDKYTLEDIHANIMKFAGNQIMRLPSGI